MKKKKKLTVHWFIDVEWDSVGQYLTFQCKTDNCLYIYYNCLYPNLILPFLDTSFDLFGHVVFVPWHFEREKPFLFEDLFTRLRNGEGSTIITESFHTINQSREALVHSYEQMGKHMREYSGKLFELLQMNSKRDQANLEKNESQIHELRTRVENLKDDINKKEISLNNLNFTLQSCRSEYGRIYDYFTSTAKICEEQLDLASKVTSPTIGDSNTGNVRPVSMVDGSQMRQRINLIETEKKKTFEVLEKKESPLTDVKDVKKKGRNP